MDGEVVIWCYLVQKAERNTAHTHKLMSDIRDWDWNDLIIFDLFRPQKSQFRPGNEDRKSEEALSLEVGVG